MIFAKCSFSSKCSGLRATQYSLLIALFFMANISFAFDRKVLFEDFTSTTCPPCAAAAPALEQALEDVGDDQVAAVAFHVWWPAPGNDPWCADNRSENQHRTTTYYGINGAPTFKIDGTTYAGSRTRAAFASAIRDRQRRASPFQIELEASIVNDVLNVSAEVTADGDMNGVNLYIALTEDYYYYAGATNQRDHYDAMVKMIPNASGTRFSIDDEDTETFEFEQDMEGLGWHELELGNLILVAWIQNDGSKEVYQAQNFFFPAVTVGDWEVTDAQNGDDDGRPEAGETVEFIVNIENGPNRGSIENITVTLSTENEQIEITNDSFDIEFLDGGDSFSNAETPFQFNVSEDFVTRPTTFNILVTSQEGGALSGKDATFMIGWSDVLVVDASYDDNASEAIMENFDTDEMPYAERIAHDPENPLVLRDIRNFQGIIWHSFNTRIDIITESEQEALMEYLDEGGTVIFSSVAFCRDYGDTQLMQEYFKADPDNIHTNQKKVVGIDGDQHFDGMVIYAGGDTRNGGAGDPSYAPSISAREGGIVVMDRVNSSGRSYGAAAVSHQTETYRTLLMSFPIESVEGHFNTDSRESFISRLWNWYSNPSGAELSNPQEIYEFKLSPAFPNPFNSQSVAMFKLNNSGMINLSLYDLSGRLVSTIENNYYNVGSHQITIDANAMSLKSGTYILKLSAGELSMNQKLLFLK